MLTLLGATLAFMLLGVWLIFMCVAKILASLLLGRYLLKKNKNKEDSLIWPLVLGVALAQIIFSIPVLSWLLSLIAVWWGLGGLFLYFRKA
jgi:ABC-type Mn2+/Zn2+ transport system permease subunit